MSAEEREKWNRKHRDRGFYPSQPSALVTACEPYLPPPGGRALDVAGGSGRHALWLAERGFEVTLADISEAGLEIAEEEANKRRILLSTICIDFETEPFPSGLWSVILCFHYLHRPLFREFAGHLSSGGVLIFVQPTVRNLERHSHPSERFLLRKSELPRLAEENGLDIVFHQEDWSAEGRHEALLVASSSTAS